MPATSEAQARTARAALGVKSGSLTLRELPAGFAKAVKSMLSMSESDLKDFSHTKKGAT